MGDTDKIIAKFKLTAGSQEALTISRLIASLDIGPNAQNRTLFKTFAWLILIITAPK